MNLSTLDIIISETGPFILAYVLYSFVVYTFIQSRNHRIQVSRLKFGEIFKGNFLLFITSVVLFSGTMIGYWFGIRIGNDEANFSWIISISSLVVMVLLSEFLYRRADFQVKSSLYGSIIAAILFVLPFFITAIFITAISGADYSH